jgi:hypothetical protein
MPSDQSDPDIASFSILLLLFMTAALWGLIIIVLISIGP